VDKEYEEKDRVLVNVFKKCVNERNFEAYVEDYNSNVLDQTLSQFYIFRNSVIFASILLLPSNCNGSS